MSRTDRPAWPWRLLAWIMFLFVGLLTIPALFLANVSQLIFHLLPSWIAFGGLFAYGYGFRARPLWFWRVFAALFSLYTMASLGGNLGRFVAIVRDGAAPGNAHIFAVAASVPLCFLTCVALLRHAQLLRGRQRSQMRDLEGIFA